MQSVEVARDPRMDAQTRAAEYASKLCGHTFKHFKGNLYKVLEIGVDSETAELQVVYMSYNLKDLGGRHKIWIRPLDMFLSKVDKEKYPLVEQEYRFKQIDPPRRCRKYDPYVGECCLCESKTETPKCEYFVENK